MLFAHDLFQEPGDVGFRDRDGRNVDKRWLCYQLIILLVLFFQAVDFLLASHGFVGGWLSSFSLFVGCECRFALILLNKSLCTF